MTPLVKICGITSEADALVCVGLGADAIGFIMAPSPRQVTASLVADVVKRIPPEVLTVGVFRDESPQRVVEIANATGIGAVQLHGHESPYDVRYVTSRVACTIRAYSAGDRSIERFEELGAQYILIDGPSPGSGEVFDWRLAEGVVDPSRMFISGGLHPDNVDQAIAHLHPFGVDVASGVEAAPGRKDPKLVRRFVEAVRATGGTTPGAAGSRADDVSFMGGDRSAAGADDSDGADAGDGPYDWMGG